MISKIKNAAGLLKSTAFAWSDDNVSMMSGSLAYSTVFSIAPLLVIAIAVAGFVFGEQASNGQIFKGINDLIGADGAEAIQAMVKSSAQRPNTGIFATLVGIVTLVVGASNAFQQLQQSLNMIWKVRLKSTHSFWALVHKRLLTFSMVLVIAFLLLVSLILTTFIAALGEFLGNRLPGGEVFWHVVNAALSFGVTTVLFAAIFKILPDVKLIWKDVWIGGVVTAFFFTVGKFLIGLYLGHSSVSSSYGAVGSLVVFLLWVYFSTAILLYGAEFTRLYATRNGKVVPPVEEAELYSIQAAPSLDKKT
ncbi:MAG: YihY/virulence factor BrkB family protein [Bdellovibrionia bacterium]